MTGTFVGSSISPWVICLSTNEWTVSYDWGNCGRRGADWIRKKKIVHYKVCQTDSTTASSWHSFEPVSTCKVQSTARQSTLDVPIHVSLVDVIQTFRTAKGKQSRLMATKLTWLLQVNSFARVLPAKKSAKSTEIKNIYLWINGKL